MAFILALVALVAAFGCWHFFWSDAGFTAFLAQQSPQYGPKWKIVFWASVAFAAWGLLINQPAPSSVSLLVSAVTLALWIASPNGQKFLKDTF